MRKKVKWVVLVLCFSFFFEMLSANQLNQAQAGESQNTAQAESLPQGTPPSGDPPNGDPLSGTSPNGDAPNGQPPGGGSMTENNGTAATTFDTDTTQADGSFTSVNDDENAVRVENSAKVTLANATITQTGDTSNAEDSDFYGLNAGILARDKALLMITGGSVTTDATGGNGIFVYGEGTSAVISDTVIRTSKNNSGGIELAGGGTIEASNLDIDTRGNSSAALRSDRGGGTMTVDKGTYVTNGTGSPAVYSTANISVKNATLTGNSSEVVVIEGKNSVVLTDCTLSSNMTGTYGVGSGENLHAIMIYQSMSGDASVGHGSFTMSGGSLVSKNGDTFYVTNTSCTIDLADVSIVNADGNLLTVSGNDASHGWGNVGSNGGTCDLTVSTQILEGSIVVDQISSLTMKLTDNSSFNGTVNSDGQGGNVNVALDGTSTWTLTDNAYITEFDGNVDNITTGNYHVYVGGVVLK